MIEQIVRHQPVTLDAVQRVLGTELANAETNVLSLSIDDEHQRSRVELAFDNTPPVAPATLALMAAQALRRSFGGALGALRVDVYRHLSDGSGSTTLVATHGSFLSDIAYRSA